MSCTAFTANWIKSITNGDKAIIVSNVFSIPPSLYFSRLTQTKESYQSTRWYRGQYSSHLYKASQTEAVCLSQAEAVNTESSFYVDQRYIV